MSSSARSSLAGMSEELGAELVTDGSFAAVTPGSELLTNPGIETYTGTQDDGTSDTFGGWSRSGNDVNNIIDATATVSSGANAVKFISDGSALLRLLQFPIAVTPGNAMRFSFDSRGDGVIAGVYAIYDISNANYIVNFATTGITGVAYDTITYDFNVPAGCTELSLNVGLNNLAGTAYFDNISLKVITFTNWTAGTGWAPQATAGALTGKAQKVAGTASDLEQDVSAVAKAVYRVVHTATRTAGSETPKVGGASGAAHASAATFTDNIGPATTTGNLQFSADATFAGTIDDVSAKEIVRRAIPD